ncbi:hypothetical protein Agub_g1069, partial [Astrephomene gubernaculifera]
GDVEVGKDTEVEEEDGLEPKPLGDRTTRRAGAEAGAGAGLVAPGCGEDPPPAGPKAVVESQLRCWLQEAAARAGGLLQATRGWQVALRLLLLAEELLLPGARLRLLLWLPPLAPAGRPVWGLL